MKIGEVIPKNGEIVINEGKETVTVIVKHTGDRYRLVPTFIFLK